jgi:hypothetical protein
MPRQAGSLAITILMIASSSRLAVANLSGLTAHVIKTVTGWVSMLFSLRPVHKSREAILALGAGRITHDWARICEYRSIIAQLNRHAYVAQTSAAQLIAVFRSGGSALEFFEGCGRAERHARRH